MTMAITNPIRDAIENGQTSLYWEMDGPVITLRTVTGRSERGTIRTRKLWETANAAKARAMAEQIVRLASVRDLVKALAATVPGISALDDSTYRGERCRHGNPPHECRKCKRYKRACGEY